MLFRSLHAGIGFQHLEKLVDFALFKFNRQQSVAERIVLENIRKRRRDNAAEAVFKKCPGGVFARRTIAKIGLSDEDACTLVHGEVKDKVGIGLCFFGISQR